MKLKIVSDGTDKGTKVIDEMGNVVEHVLSVQWQISAGMRSRATIELINVPIETMALDGKRQIRKRLIRCLGDTVVEQRQTTIEEEIKNGN